MNERIYENKGKKEWKEEKEKKNNNVKEAMRVAPACPKVLLGVRNE